eukprot:NODE_154_length_16838_cov_0.293327.p8 type:complete len:220 gc:universal NODE_154_length_16838_cov_0.293327:16323-15664(-)
MEEEESNPKSTFFMQFVKSGDWAQQLVEQVSDFLYVVSPSGVITYASPSSFQVTGFLPNELVGRYLGEFVHPDDGRGLSNNLQESLLINIEFSIMHRFRRKKADYIILEVRGKPIRIKNKQYVLNISREYPSKISTMMDSLIELKLENEQLKQRYGDKLEKMDGGNKNKRIDDDKVCTECGTNESPEWRKGPTGAKTLCNACGLRYAKRKKIEQQTNNQ